MDDESDAIYNRPASGGGSLPKPGFQVVINKTNFRARGDARVKKLSNTLTLHDILEWRIIFLYVYI